MSRIVCSDSLATAESTGKNERFQSVPKCIRRVPCAGGQRTNQSDTIICWTAEWCSRRCSTQVNKEKSFDQCGLFLSSRKIRLDVDHCSYRPSRRKLPTSSSSSLLSQLHDELNGLPAEVYSIEFTTTSNGRIPTGVDDDYLNKNGIILRCKLLETPNPILPPLRLRISTRYPDEPPEILSLTKTMSPKLEFTGSNLHLPSTEPIRENFARHWDGLSVDEGPRFDLRAVGIVNSSIASQNESRLWVDMMRKAPNESQELEEQRVQEWLLVLLICQIE